MPDTYRISMCLTCRRQVNFHEKCCDRWPEPVAVIATYEAVNVQNEIVGLGERLVEELRDHAVQGSPAAKAVTEWDDFMADRFVQAIE